MIAISGPAGSGKTTLARLLSELLRIPLISTGIVFRGIAEERGIDVLQLNLLAEKDHSIDLQLDSMIVEQAKGMKDCILESRLACLMLRRAGMAPFCIYVNASEEIRASRIGERDGEEFESSLGRMREREKSEKRRYMAIYGMDPSDERAYDLVLDSSGSPPDELAEKVLGALRRDGGG